MPSLHTDIFMFHLPYLAVRRRFQFLHGTGERIVVQLAVRLFLRSLKMQFCLAFAGRLVESTFFAENALFRDRVIRRVQLIRRAVGTGDRLFEHGIGAFLIRKLQTGGRTAADSRTLPHRLFVRFRLLLCVLGFPVFRRTRGKIERRVCRFFGR